AGDDPQGTPVDKLFRLEKFVPDGCIGATEEFVDAAAVQDDYDYAGQYRLRGLAGGRHTLFVVKPCGLEQQREIALCMTRAAIHDFWDLGTKIPSRVLIVSGYIPPDDGGAPMIHAGNRDALLRAYGSLAKVQRYLDVDWRTSREM